MSVQTSMDAYVVSAPVTEFEPEPEGDDTSGQTSTASVYERHARKVSAGNPGDPANVTEFEPEPEGDDMSGPQDTEPEPAPEEDLETILGKLTKEDLRAFVQLLTGNLPGTPDFEKHQKSKLIDEVLKYLPRFIDKKSDLENCTKPEHVPNFRKLTTKNLQVLFKELTGVLHSDNKEKMVGLLKATLFNEGTCGICLEEMVKNGVFGTGLPAAIQFPCDHRFCENCAFNGLMSGNKNCALCRALVPSEFFEKIFDVKLPASSITEGSDEHRFLMQFIKKSREQIASKQGVIDWLLYEIDDLRTKISDLRAGRVNREINELRDQIEQLEDDNSDLTEINEQFGVDNWNLNQMNDELRDEIEALQDKIMILEESLKDAPQRTIVESEPEPEPTQ